MRNMLRAAALALSVAALFAVNASTARATVDVVAGDVLHFSAGPGSSITNGGEFKVQVNGGILDQFRTFCVQVAEPLNFSNNFVVAAVSTFSVLDFQPLAPETAYLYTEFRAGTLAGYDYGNAVNREADAAMLQTAIWFFQDQVTLTPLAQANNDFIQLALAAGWTDIGDVRIANLVFESDDPSKIAAQDVLVLVPEPASILAWSLIGGCFVVGHRIRRNRMIAG